MYSTYLNNLVRMFFQIWRFGVHILLKITWLIPSRKIVEFWINIVLFFYQKLLGWYQRKILVTLGINGLKTSAKFGSDPQAPSKVILSNQTDTSYVIGKYRS